MSPNLSARHLESRGAQLEVTLQSPAGLRLSQTDQFDTPYNQADPEEYRKDVANH